MFKLEMIQKEMQVMEKRAFTRYTATDENDYLTKLYVKTPIANDFVKQVIECRFRASMN
jgi:hypothetical protein